MAAPSIEGMASVALGETHASASRLPPGTIAATEIWKRFRADRRRAFFQDEVSRFMDRMRGRTTRGWTWALRDVELRAEPGESIGLIGPNGSGKTTFLKILTRVMYPTAGSVDLRGRVGALIAINAGIHPNLTGRENVMLTGTLMGLSRRDVAGRFDDIVEFAGLGHAIDRQAKFYSVGMLTRLGFGVAAFLEPDVLLVDEVLAVGDASFQQRCLDRMREVLQQGTTLVFVSHDLASVEATCSRVMWLQNGVTVADGPGREVVKAYRESVEKATGLERRIEGRIALESVKVASGDGGSIHTEGPVEFELALTSNEDYRAWLYIGITEGTASPIVVLSAGREIPVGPGRNVVRCRVDHLPLPRGKYFLWIGAYQGSTNGPELIGWQSAAPFDVYGPDLDEAPVAVVRLSPVQVISDWSLER
jgi:ABC-type polysaccharide/polyol phosphate transport system ATPase subunit